MMFLFCLFEYYCFIQVLSSVSVFYKFMFYVGFVRILLFERNKNMFQTHIVHKYVPNKIKEEEEGRIEQEYKEEDRM